jgi:1,4-alpha-glucan branching enzyme
MHLHDSLFKRPSRYSAKAHSKPINFYCIAPNATQVCLAGDFNQWNPSSHPMHQQADGTWFIQIHLPHGHHHYWFVIDGTPALDPRAQGIGRNEMNQRVSLIAVS